MAILGEVACLAAALIALPSLILWLGRRQASNVFRPEASQKRRMAGQRMVHLTAVFFCLTLGGALRATAGESPDARERAAMRQCLAGNVQGGVALLDELYLQTGDVTAIYNEARCFQWNARHDQAIGHFREYLRKTPGASEEERGRIAAYIREIERERDARASGPLEARGREADAPQAAAPGSSGLLRAAGISAAAGVVLAAVGAVLALRAQDQSNDVATRPVYDSKLDDQARRARTVSAVLLASGGAALVAAAVVGGLWMRRQERGGPALVPSLGPGQAGLALAGAF
jgi:hypothetical protein